MAPRKFSTQEIDWFNDRIANVLQNSSCCDIYHQYLKNQHNPTNFNAFKLWEKANDTKVSNDELLDLIEDVDDFNDNPLLTIAEYEHKLLYIKQECFRILERSRPNFISYLRRHHM